MNFAGRDFSLDAIQARLFNTPLLISQAKLDAIMGVVGPRLDVVRLVTPAGVLGPVEMTAEAKAERVRVGASRYGDAARQRIFQLADGVAVIPVRGTLVQRNGLDPYSGMTGYDGIWRKIDAAEADPEVRGIVLDIDSPGGEVAGCFDLADRIAGVEKPTRAILTEMACSAAYALAAACDDIWIPRTGMAGSIGVVAMHVDYSAALADAGIEVTLIFAGAHKVDGNPYEPLPDGVADELQAEIDDLYRLFAEAVAPRRGLKTDAVMALESRALAAAKALEAGLVDRVASPPEAMDDFRDQLKGDDGAPGSAVSQAAVMTKGAAAMKGNRRRAGANPEDNTEAEDRDEEKVAEDREDEKAKKAEDDDPDDRAAEDDEDGEEKDPAAEDEDGDDKPAAKRGGKVVDMKGRQPDGRAVATAIAETCELAGCPERTRAFLASKVSLAEVRQTLLAERADRQAASGVSTAHGGGLPSSAAKPGEGLVKAHQRLGNRRF
ncbi:S49 family peptidase [Minwuia thermotolerans]|uniref:S49 family peptidase n=1 Tax=Minwuia thermotolerans TaxID=2056226 RepID=UPI0019CFCE79|nr:S49 family peptidase [Minwuia thermotolerans]